MKRVGKKGAIELSIGTIVIIVLAMTMLILGIILVRSIFTGAKYNVDTMNEKVKDEINKLFVEDKKTVVYLPNQKAEIKQTQDWGIAFAIKNLEQGSGSASAFSYEISVSDPDVYEKCGVEEAFIEDWITTGRADTITILPGDSYYGITRFAIPEGAPLCTVRFHLEVEKSNQVYATDFFDVEVLAK